MAQRQKKFKRPCTLRLTPCAFFHYPASLRYRQLVIAAYAMGCVKNSLFLIDGLVKSPKTVMPDLIRHPEVIGFTGFRLSPE